MKSKFLGVVAGAVIAAVTASAGAAVSDPQIWKGVTWTTTLQIIPHDGGTQFDGTYDVTIGATPPTGSQGAGIGYTTATTTNWVQFSFIDRQNANGTWPFIEMFYAGPGGNVDNARGNIGAGYPHDTNTQFRLQDGTPLTANAGVWGKQDSPAGAAALASEPYNGFYAEPRYQNPGTTRTPSFAVSSGSNVAITDNGTDLGIGSILSRVDGATVTVKIGRLPNGMIEHTILRQGGNVASVYDQWTSSYFQNDPLIGQINFGQIELRVGNTDANTTYTFLDYRDSAHLNGASTPEYTLGQAIPEPASLGLLAAGSVLMLARRRKMA